MPLSNQTDSQGVTVERGQPVWVLRGDQHGREEADWLRAARGLLRHASLRSRPPTLPAIISSRRRMPRPRLGNPPGKCRNLVSWGRRDA
ncbi:MAG: DUF2934 domain-containing protein [Candidatus Dormibacteria bacterium]